jgi:hypothetical protein
MKSKNRLLELLKEKFATAKAKKTEERRSARFFLGDPSGSLLQDILFATFSDVGSITASKKMAGTSSADAKIVDFYNVLNDRLQKYGGSRYCFCSTSPFKHLSKKKAMYYLNLLPKLTSNAKNLYQLSNISNIVSGYKDAVEINKEIMNGLAISAFINNSDNLRKVVYGDTMKLDYLGAFLRRGKTLIVRGETGNHFGYCREPGSFVSARKLIDVSKPKKFASIFYKAMATEVKELFLLDFEFLAGIEAALIGLYEISGYVDRLINLPPPSILLNSAAAITIALMGGYAPFSGIARAYKDYKNQKARFPEYYEKKAYDRSKLHTSRLSKNTRSAEKIY